MKKNVASQYVSAHLISKTDGSDVTSGTTTVYVTGDGGTQAAGSGTVTHKGNGLWLYAPTQSETNYDHVVFTFVNSSAVSVDVQIYTTYPQSGDAYSVVTNGTYGNAALNTDLDTLLSRIIGTLASGTHQPQSGDSYAIVNNGTYGNSALNSDLDTLLSRIIGTLDSGTHKPQSGDSYAKVTDATYGLSALNTDLDTLLTRIVGTLAAGTHQPQSGDSYAIVNNGTYGNSALNTDLDAIKAKTDQLNFTVSNRVDANVTHLSGTSQTARDLGANIDATISSRAPASTALSNTTWTDAKAGYLDAAISTRLAGASYTAPNNTGISDIYSIVSSPSYGNSVIKTVVDAIKSVSDKLDTAMELDGSVYRFTSNALEMAPTGGGGGSADWTDSEKAQIRDALGITGTKSAAVGGQLQSIKDTGDTLASRLTAGRAAYLDNLSGGAVAKDSDIQTLLSRIVGTLASGTHYPQSGDSYVIVNSGTHGLSVIKGLVDDLETRLSSTRAGYLDYLGDLPSDISYLKTRIIGTLASGTHNPQSGDTYSVVTSVTYGNSAIKTLLDAIKAKTDLMTFTSTNLNAHVKALDDIDLSATMKSSILTVVNSSSPSSVQGDVGGKVLGGGSSVITGVGAWVKDHTGANVAPASTALSTSIWTSDRASFLDNLNGHVPQTGDSYAVVTNVTYGNSALKTAINNLNSICNLIKAKTDYLTFTGGYVNSQIKGLDNIDFSATMKSSLNAATPAGITGNVNGKVLGGGSGTITGAGVWAYTHDGANIAPASTALSSSIWTSEKASYLDASISSRATNDGVWGYATRTLTSSGTIPADVVNYTIESSLSMAKVLRIMLAALAGKSSGGGTTTITFRDVADSKNRISATVDANGNRTAITLNGD